jgi:proline dehydrogenase
MSDKPNNLPLDQHEHYGQRLKSTQAELEQLRASLIQTYEKTSSKDARQIQQVIDKLRLIQVSMHSRLISEYPDKSDSELLPIYLGR